VSLRANLFLTFDSCQPLAGQNRRLGSSLSSSLPVGTFTLVIHPALPLKMLPRSLNRIATKSSTTAAAVATASQPKPKRLSVPHLSRRALVHPSRADRAAVVELPAHSPSIPPGALSLLLSFISHFLISRPFDLSSSLQTRPTAAPTANLRPKPNLPRCSGPLFLLLTIHNCSLPLVSAGDHRNGPPRTRRHDALFHRYVWKSSLKDPCLRMGG